MTQSFKCQKCGAQVPAKDMQHHERTGDSYYQCHKCQAKNRVIRRPTPEGAPIELVPAGIISEP